jgi:acyl carrier protein
MNMDRVIIFVMQAGLLVAEITNAEASGLAPDTPLKHLNGWDSLKTVRLVVRIEEAIKRELTEAEVETLCTVQDVARLLSQAT